MTAKRQAKGTKKANKAVIGRPSRMTPENCDEIIERLTNGETLSGICRDPRLPARTTILYYRNKNPAFADRYARARRDQMETWSDQIVDISDDGTTDYITKIEKATPIVTIKAIPTTFAITASLPSAPVS